MTINTFLNLTMMFSEIKYWTYFMKIRTLFCLMLLGLFCNAEGLSKKIVNSKRIWHHSTVIYGDCFRDKNGYNIWRARGNVNCCLKAPKLRIGSTTVNFSINKLTLPYSKIILGTFVNIYPHHTKRTMDNGIGIALIANGNDRYIALLQRKGSDKIIQTSPIPWKLNQNYKLEIKKGADKTFFYLDGKVVFIAPELKVQSTFAVGVKNAHLIINGLTVQSRGKLLLKAENPIETCKLSWQPLDFGLEHFKALEKSGIKTIMVAVPFELFWNGSNSYDFARLKSMLELLKHRLPEDKFIIRLLMRHKAWNKNNKKELQVVYTPDGRRITGPGYNPISFASQKWNQAFAKALKHVVNYCEKSPFAPAIAGYCLMAGDGGEWSYGFRNYLSDYSEPQRQAFISFAKQKYQNDLKKLNSVWKTNIKSFDSITIPDYKRRLNGDKGIFLSPKKSMKVIDFNKNLSDTVMKAVAKMTEIVKKCAPDKLCGVYYGYHFMPGDHLGDLTNTGHRAFNKLLKDPNIDFVGAPQMYYNRKCGGGILSQTLPKSLEIHGKFFLNEDDTRTFLTPIHSPSFPPPYEKNLEDSQAVLLRNAASTLLKKNGILMWMEMGANWFNHPKFTSLAQKLSKWLQSDMYSRPSNPEIAVVVSDKTYFYTSFTNALSKPLLSRTMMHSVIRIGAPFDTILLEDIPKAPNYKLYIFMDCCLVDKQAKKMIHATLEKNRATALWMYASGICNGKTIDVANSSKLTGHKLKYTSKTAKIILKENGQELKASISPLVYVPTGMANSQALKAKLTDGNMINFAPLTTRRIDGKWISIWSGSPMLTTKHLRKAAKIAGVHIYSDKNDQIFCGKNFLVLHSFQKGPRKIILPRPAKVMDFISGKRYKGIRKNIVLNIKAGETKAFILE